MSEWTNWEGGDFGDTAAFVEVKLRDGSESGPRPATAFYWRHDDTLNPSYHIVGYRVVGLASKIVDAVECDIETGKPLDEFHSHEALDRLHIVLCMIDDHLLCHPFIEARPDIKGLILGGSKTLSRALQLVGAEDVQMRCKKEES